MMTVAATLADRHVIHGPVGVCVRLQGSPTDRTAGEAWKAFRSLPTQVALVSSG